MTKAKKYESTERNSQWVDVGHAKMKMSSSIYLESTFTE